MKQSTKRVIMTGVIGGLLSGAVKMGWEALILLEHHNVKNHHQ